MNRRQIALSLALCLGFSHSTHAAQAAISSAHPLATQAGMDVLKAGGNAFDAAIAVTSTLAVVEPYSSGLGGGGFYLLHRQQDGFETMLDARERAPLSAHRDLYLSANGEVVSNASMDGPLAAGIPGIPAALAHLADHYGALPLADSMAASIQWAKQGFRTDDHYQRMAQFRSAALRQSPDAAGLFLDAQQNAPQPGFLVQQGDLAETLTRIATQGRKGFYQGELAQRLVKGVRAHGGIWRLEDLTEYKIIEREPVRGEYHGMKITSVPPPSSGGVVLVEILNILAGYPLETMTDGQVHHLIIEAMRRAYRDRAVYLGDPDFVEMPLSQLTHPLYAAGLRAGIHGDRASRSEELPGKAAEAPKGQDTTHFSIIDKQGNRVAATLSINYPFGSGFVAPGTGVLLNDEMDDFSAKPGVPNAYGLVGAEANAIAPGKRMLSSMTPTFLEKDGRIAILGTPGGSRIITMVLLAALDFYKGHNAQSMVSLPRFHHQYLPDRVQYEPGALARDVAKHLRKLGHNLQRQERAYGNMHIVIQDENGVQAASDPRGRGQAQSQ